MRGVVLATAGALSLWALSVMVVGAWALFGAPIRAWIAAWIERRRPKRALPAIAGRAQPVLLLRPCAGRDVALSHNLRSLADAERGGLELRCVFAVHDERDAAWAEALDARRWLESVGVRSEVVATRAVGPNHKVDQLERARAGRASDVVIVADSDVDLTGVDLGALVAPLVSGRDAAQWVAVSERGASEALGDRASVAVLSGGLHSFALLSRLDPAGMVGKLFAVRSDALDAVGGFGALVRYLGEDMELSRRLRAEGWRVRAAPFVAFSTAGHRSFAATRDRYARWLLVVRLQRAPLMLSYPLLFFAAPLQVILALVLAPWWPAAFVSIAAAVVVWRSALAAGARRASGLPWAARATLLDAWLGDAVLMLAWLRALSSREARWRGGTLRFDERGLLRDERASP